LVIFKLVEINIKLVQVRSHQVNIKLLIGEKMSIKSQQNFSSWVGSGRVGLGQVGLGQVKLGQIESGQFGFRRVGSD
jgi:hypothetical protein